MANIELAYNLDTRTWTNPSGTTGTSWLPELTFGEAPTLAITLGGSLPQRMGDAVSWSVAIAKDWLKSTVPMCRTTEGVSVAGGVAVCPIDTATERYLAVVDGVAGGVSCWMQITGYDGTRTPVVEITLPVVCAPALDPVGAGTIPPIKTTELSADQIQAMIDNSIASAIGITSQPVLAYGGEVAQGKVYEIDLTEDTALNVATAQGYCESVVFVRTRGFALTQGTGIDRWSLDTAENMLYRVLVNWTPFGVIVESTGEWIDA